MIKNHFPEEILKVKFIEYYTSNYFEKYYSEVPVFSRSVDIVKFDEENNTLTAIELKINDWKRAINQVLNVSMCFDYLAICIPRPKTLIGQKKIIDYCSEIGIGIYFFNNEDQVFEHLCLEKKTKDIWDKQKNQIFKYITEVK